MSSSDDPDTNTSDKCVSGERNRERERDSGVVCVLVICSRIGPILLTEPDEQDRLPYQLLSF